MFRGKKKDVLAVMASTCRLPRNLWVMYILLPRKYRVNPSWLLDISLCFRVSKFFRAMYPLTVSISHAFPRQVILHTSHGFMLNLGYLIYAFCLSSWLFWFPFISTLTVHQAWLAGKREVLPFPRLSPLANIIIHLYGDFILCKKSFTTLDLRNPWKKKTRTFTTYHLVHSISQPSTIC